MRIFERKSEITRRILGVLGSMRTGCVGVEVEHLSSEKGSGVGDSVGRFHFPSPRLPKTQVDSLVFDRPPGLEKKIVPHRLHWIHRLYVYSCSLNGSSLFPPFLFLPFSSSFLLFSLLVLSFFFFFLNHCNNSTPLQPNKNRSTSLSLMLSTHSPSQSLLRLSTVLL